MSEDNPVAFVLASSDHGTLIVNRFDYARPDEKSISPGVGVSILKSGNHDILQVQFLGTLFQWRRERGDGVVVLDIGANVGDNTIPWAKSMHGWGEVIAFEPQERIFYALAGNIALNNCTNARALWAAVSDRSGQVEIPRFDFTKQGNFSGLSLKPQKHHQSPEGGASDMVACLRVDDFEFPRVDVIKIDVEGMELEVIAGAKETIERHQPIVYAEHLFCGKPAIHAALPGYRFMDVSVNTLAMPEDDPLWDRIRIE